VDQVAIEDFVLLYLVPRNEGGCSPPIMAIPSMLMAICMPTPWLISTMAKWAAKDREYPRQKISRECWPHTTAGNNHRDCSRGQSLGTNRTRDHRKLRK